MPRYYDKTAYWVLPIERDSILYRSVMEDAQKLGMRVVVDDPQDPITRHVVSKLIIMRLAEFYEQRRKLQQKEEQNHET